MRNYRYGDNLLNLVALRKHSRQTSTQTTSMFIIIDRLYECELATQRYVFIFKHGHYKIILFQFNQNWERFFH